MNKTYTIASVEIRRERFPNVTDRRDSKQFYNDISIIPQGEITQFPILECSNQTSRNSSTLVSESLAYHQTENIVLASERHLKKSIKKVKLKNLRPKLTSSTLSEEITFNVKNASTPKQIQRSSTPRMLLKLKKNILTSTLIEKRSLNSGLTDLSNIKVSDQNTHKCKKNLRNSNKKRLKKSKKIDFVDFISSTGLSNEINIDQINNKPFRGNGKCLEKSEWKKLKYPIKYYPNMKLKDINRLDNVEELYNRSCPSTNNNGNSFIQNTCPYANGCCIYGDYKFWIV